VAEPTRWRAGSVRTRVMLAATAVAALALAIAAAALIAVLRTALVHDIDQVAELRAAAIVAGPASGRLASPLPADDDEEIQVLDRSGQVVAASANLLGRPPIAAVPAGTQPPPRTIRDPRGGTGQYRLVTVRVGGPEEVTVHVATSLKFADDTVVVVRTSLFVGAPLLLALVAWLTWLSVGRALRPVEQIRAQVADISSRDLGRRVAVPRSGDEIARLATTMNAMLDRLQAAAERQRRFVADASHELQTPLAAARTDLEVSLAHPQAGSWPDTARDLLAQNQRMQRLVADLLFIARGESGTARAAPVPVDLHEVVLDEVRRLPGVDGLRVDTAGVRLAFVAGRAEDLARAVRNLLDNAVRHAASRVEVAVTTGDGLVILTVHDDGPGVPVPDRTRVFDRFTRLDRARSRSTGGTGLGLAIVKDIVEGHHGHVHIADGAAGARFVVTLPAD